MNNKVTSNYDENSIITLDWREGIRQNLGMYIGDADERGLLHLIVEAVANSIDECAAGYGKKITISIDSKTNAVTIQDEGRGLPFRQNASGDYAIVEVMTNMHAGGKFEGAEGYKSSLGLHGLGLKLINALSTRCYVKSVRTDGECEILFENGICKSGPTIKNGKHKNTGTTVHFIPDKDIFHNLKWNLSKINERIQTDALLNNNITFEIVVDGKTYVKYCYKDGIRDLFTIKSGEKTLLTTPIFHKVRVVDETKNVAAEVEYGFAYSDEGYETIYSYVNGGYTPNDGTHVTGFKTAFTKYINKLAKDNGIEKSFDGTLIRRGLILVLVVRADFRLAFAEQTKYTLNSPEARGLVSKAVGQMILDKKDIKQVLDKIMIDQKAEDAAQRKREAQERIAKGGKNMKRYELPENLADATDFSGETELILTEGLSAMGNIVSTKDRHTAVLGLRGKIKNVCGMELDEALKSETIRDILNCLGCGIGDNFNMKNLRYDRIIIEADSDVDGGHIELLLCMMFLHLLPEVVAAGKLYSCVSPVYRVIDARKNVLYFYSEREAQKWFRTHRGFKALHVKGLGELGAAELYETTLNPKNRRLVQLKPEDIIAATDYFNRIMGKDSNEKRKIINEYGFNPEGEMFDFDDAAMIE